MTLINAKPVMVVLVLELILSAMSLRSIGLGCCIGMMVTPVIATKANTTNRFAYIVMFILFSPQSFS